MESAVEPRPRPLFCILRAAHADVVHADRIVLGIFEEAGRTCSMALPPDWRTDQLPDDGQWRIAWHKFYYGLDLSHAQAASGDRRYFDTWKMLVLSFVEQVPPDWERDGHVIGRRILNWLYAWDRFASLDGYEGLGRANAERLRDHLAAQVQFLLLHLTPERNHRTIELTAIVHFVLAFPDLDADGAIMAYALDELRTNLFTDILEDGVHAEVSTHYHMITLRNFVAVRMNLGRYGVALPAGFDERLQAGFEFAMHVHRPDGTIPAVADADDGSYLDVLLLAATIYERPDMRFVATSGRIGSAPAQTNVDFAHGGYYLQRSGWGRDHDSFVQARYLLFDCGPVGQGGHGHYDMLHVEVAALGRPLLVDPGRYTYSEAEPNWRHWFKGTRAHNTVCIDRLDQSEYSCWDVLRPPKQAQATLLGRFSSAGLDMLRGRVTSPCYDAVHERDVLFVDGDYWLLVDRLRAAAEHRYELRFHLTKQTNGQLVIHEKPHGFDTMDLAMRALGVDTLEIEQGWVSERYGYKSSAPVASFVGIGRDRDFLTLVLPQSAKERRNPQLLMAHDGWLHIEGVGPWIDRFRISAGARSFETAGAVYRASIVWVREFFDGRPQRVELLDVQAGE